MFLFRKPPKDVVREESK